MGDEWLRRFLATRGLTARTPALRARSDLAALDAQHRLAGILQARLGPDGRTHLRAALLSEITLGAWRCAARNWLSGGKQPGQQRKVTGLIREVQIAFAEIPASITLSVP